MMPGKAVAACLTVDGRLGLSELPYVLDSKPHFLHRLCRLDVVRCHDRGLRRGPRLSGAYHRFRRRRYRQANLLHICRRAPAAAAAADPAAGGARHPAVSSPPRRPQVQDSVQHMPPAQNHVQHAGIDSAACRSCCCPRKSEVTLLRIVSRTSGHGDFFMHVQGSELQHRHGGARCCGEELRPGRARHAGLRWRCAGGSPWMRRSCLASAAIHTLWLNASCTLVGEAGGSCSSLWNSSGELKSAGCECRFGKPTELLQNCECESTTLKSPWGHRMRHPAAHHRVDEMHQQLTCASCSSCKPACRRIRSTPCS